MGVHDRLARPMRDLRVSVTDRCNFRCSYCMPMEVFGPGFHFLAGAEVLSFEEIAEVVRAAADLGVTKVRLTGGEPLLRRRLPALVELLAAVPGVTDLALTTNGALLSRYAADLAAAGLGRVTVSLDSVDPTVFRAMNGVGVELQAVLEGIEAAAATGLQPVKLNSVVRRGVNDGGVLDLADFARRHGDTLRLIEYMDVGESHGWRLEEVVPGSELVEQINLRWPLRALEPSYRGEVASRYEYCDGRGEIGLINSVTAPFCGACTRLRLSSDGKLYTCLFAAAGLDIRALLRRGEGQDELATAMTSLWTARRDRYSEQRAGLTPRSRAPKPEMSYLGG